MRSLAMCYIQSHCMHVQHLTGIHGRSLLPVVAVIPDPKVYLSFCRQKSSKYWDIFVDLKTSAPARCLAKRCLAQVVINLRPSAPGKDVLWQKYMSENKVASNSPLLSDNVEQPNNRIQLTNQNFKGVITTSN